MTTSHKSFMRSFRLPLTLHFAFTMKFKHNQPPQTNNNANTLVPCSPMNSSTSRLMPILNLNSFIQTSIPLLPKHSSFPLWISNLQTFSNHLLAPLLKPLSLLSLHTTGANHTLITQIFMFKYKYKYKQKYKQKSNSNTSNTFFFHYLYTTNYVYHIGKIWVSHRWP